MDTDDLFDDDSSDGDGPFDVSPQDDSTEDDGPDPIVIFPGVKFLPHKDALHDDPIPGADHARRRREARRRRRRERGFTSRIASWFSAAQVFRDFAKRQRGRPRRPF